jgi:CHAT domain-containing protein/tetratricopeptide (TPR) repeat protein
MKRLKILSCLFVLQVLLVIPALSLVAEAPVSPDLQTGDQGSDRTIESIANQVKEYREAGKFEEALKLLDTAFEKFPPKKYREKLQVERANLHFRCALSLYKKYDFAKAIKHFEIAYAIDKIYRLKNAADDLNNIGFLYSALGQKPKALAYYEKALPIRKAVGDRAGEATTLNNIGGVYDDLGQNQKALNYLEEVLPIIQAVGDPAGEATTLSNLMVCWVSLKNTQFSIFYGKQSVNAFQNLRENISKLDRMLKKSYLVTTKNAYRFLAGLLIDEGRLSEAQHVSDMLKEKEFFDFIRRDASAVDILSTQVDYTEFEKQWLKNYNSVMKELATISSEYHVLKFKKNKTEVENRRIKELDLKLKEAQKSYEEFLVQLKAAFDKHEKEIKAGKIDPAALAKEVSKLQKTLKYLDETEGNKHAALHYMLYEGLISVILTTPSSQSVKQTEIDEKEFNLLIMNYRNLTLKLGDVRHKIREKVKRGQKLLETPDYTLEKKLTKEKKEIEKKLYDAIFKPVDQELKKYGATNLVISLDGVLRYIPLPALWDGKNYLVQRYRISLITPFSLKNIKDEPLKEKKILGFGASRGGQGFAPLPYVGREIRSIVKDEEKGYYGLIKGKAFIDNDFTRDTMVEQLKSRSYPLVHISSHFKFSPGDETKNHLLLGDGSTMRLSEIRRMGKLFDNVKLLVLSACQTGVGGNGEEIDGFGELAQQSGAKSVIASLWPVADESTKELMVNFYRIMKKGKVSGKIEALRQAQLELAGLDDLLQKDKSKGRQASRQKTKYASSYFWGPFIMIGNWR